MADTDFLDDLVEPTEEESAEQEQNSDIQRQVNEALTAKEKGFYKEMKQERIKRQELQSKLDHLTGTINAVLASRANQQEQPAPTGKKQLAGIPIAETEDGDLFLPEDALQKIVAPYEEKIRNLETFLQRSTVARNSESEAQKVIEAIVGEDEQHGPAYQKYRAARKWANDRVVEFQRENGINGPMTPGQALDYVFDDNSEKEFSEKFPGVPLEEIVMAEESQRNFRRMLKTLAKSNADTRRNDTTAQGERFKKLLKKPPGLGSTPNAKAGHLSVGEKLDTFSTNDLLGLTDAQVEALHKALRDEERAEGLIFK